MAQTYFTISTSVSGFVSPTQLANSGSVYANAPDFSSCGNLYSSYRVVAMECHVEPFFPVNTTGVTVPAALAVCSFQAGAAPNTYQNILDGSDSRLCSGYKAYTFAVDFRGDPNARLWTVTTSAITSANTYGLAVAGSSTASTVSTLVWAVAVWSIVEFQTSA